MTKTQFTGDKNTIHRWQKNHSEEANTQFTGDKNIIIQVTKTQFSRWQKHNSPGDKKKKHFEEANTQFRGGKNTNQRWQITLFRGLRGVKNIIHRWQKTPFTGDKNIIYLTGDKNTDPLLITFGADCSVQYKTQGPSVWRVGLHAVPWQLSPPKVGPVWCRGPGLTVSPAHLTSS